MAQHPADPMHYELARIRTEAATGYFDARPEAPLSFAQALSWCRSHPNDQFMRKHLLRMVAEWSPDEMQDHIRRADREDLFLQALLLEACIVLQPFFPLQRRFSDKQQSRLAAFAPSIYIKAHRLRDHRLHRRWIKLLRPNFLRHDPLPAPEPIDLAAPVAAQAVDRAMAAPEPLDRLAERLAPPDGPVAPAGPDAAAMAAEALARLTRAGIDVGPEMRHEASLSPIALLREWQLNFGVACGRHHYRLTGRQIAFGRGLSLENARVACVMEIVERVSAYADIADNAARGYAQDLPLVRARFSELQQEGFAALDPDRLGLEAPYRDEPLYWVEGRSAAAAGAQPVRVPAQAVFLFSNLDETALFSGLGSTGLGAGATPAQARCQALLEVIERDCAATMPCVPALCFDIEPDDPAVARLMQHYAARGIRVGFVDLTGPLGVPCCKSYVVAADGTLAIGTGAHLDARRALLSALTETTYPFPNGPPSRPPSPAAVRVPLSALPDYDRGDPERNLHMLENLLLANGFEPIYVDLTRADLGLPVVRAIVPGMELLGDFDRFSRVHPRLYGHYRKYAPGPEAK
ncbi:YcaO-like family protein [Desulfatitalea alkaliphila]|uniref:YcaO-like family protein n=1 Tax=Desulfatitalea alkaliphila TaxID=2929485 RepID=A0AA41R7W3_9BACT|nr:YcaO-like family protein [Desulfatitalea alkaliphila]MCJ8502660.1 YcaO-like family protein [Desulfatitalea alkaliphila]